MLNEEDFTFIRKTNKKQKILLATIVAILFIAALFTGYVLLQRDSLSVSGTLHRQIQVLPTVTGLEVKLKSMVIADMGYLQKLVDLLWVSCILLGVSTAFIGLSQLDAIQGASEASD